MSEKTTSSRPIKLFAKIIFVIGIIFDVIMTLAIIIGGVAAVNANATQNNATGFTIFIIICALILFIIIFFLLLVEKAMLLSYAEIAEDVRDLRNAIADKQN